MEKQEIQDKTPLDRDQKKKHTTNTTAQELVKQKNYFQLSRTFENFSY